MPTMTGPPVGRERRRKGPVNRVRRFLYGLLLLAAAPGAVAVDELAAYGRYRATPPPAAAAPRSLATVQGLLSLRSRADDAPRLELDTVTAQIHDGTEPAPQFLIVATETDEGFDLALADVGTLRLELRLGGIEDDHAWSLGGKLALGAGAPADVPAVRIHTLHLRETRYLPFEVAVRETHLAFKWRT